MVEQDLPERGDTAQQGTLTVSDEVAYVGDTIEIRGERLEPGTRYELVWHSVEGSWGVIGGSEVLGQQYRPRTDRIGSVTTDADGRFDEQWELPEDYGGEHTIELRDGVDTSVAEAAIEIQQWFELEDSAAKLGETFTVVGYGLGPGEFRSNYQVTWDNRVVGFLTGVINRGTAVGKVRAVGPVGEHTLQVWRNFRGVPFLQNNTQSPFGKCGGDRRSKWVVEVTERNGQLPTAWMDSMPDEDPIENHLIDPDEETDARLSISPASGQAGTEATIAGTGFPPDTDVDLVWYTHEGHRPTGVPITPEPRELLPTVRTDSDGEFSHELTVPTDVGSTRPITAEVDGRAVASTGFVMQPDVHGISPTEGPVGTEIEIELSGVGWPRYENAYYVVYDNSPVGYVCGLDNDEGVVRTRIPAAGEPGVHFIDIYPCFYEIEADLPEFELIPHLSYGNNHPARPMPAMHFTFEVTE